jgi:short-subunit dehydrogenase
LVAGASEGIGAAFAQYFASHGLDLILIARGKEKLDDFADGLRQQYAITVSCIYIDLAAEDAAIRIIKEVGEMEVDVFTYNAAFSYIGPFEENSIDEHQQLMRANMSTPMHLVQHFAVGMLKRQRGAIILMASLAGFQGSGFLAGYAASKAFNRVLAESLWYEWKDKGVDVIACCAGATSTPNFIKTNPEESSFFAPRIQKPEEVVKECMQQLGKKPSYITGRGNRIASFIMQKILPRKMAVNIMGDSTRSMYRL